MPPDQRGRLIDILESARLITGYVAGCSAEGFALDREKQDAVVRRIEIIGEATRHLSEATRQAIPELPFRKMRGMRNVVAHDYANVDLRIIWAVATVHVPAVALLLEAWFAQHHADDESASESQP